MNPQCKVCGGATNANPRKKPESNPKMPDFLCNQENGRCGEDVQYTNRQGEVVDAFNPTPVWKPKEGGFSQYAQRLTPKAPEAGPAMPPVKSYMRDSQLVEPDDEVPAVSGPNWEKIGAQKNRSNLAAAILHGKDVDFDLLEKVEAWTITGKKPDTELEDIAADFQNQ